MDRNIRILGLIALLFVTFVAKGQDVGRLPYKEIRQTYKGDTVNTILTGDSVRYYTNKKFSRFNKAIMADSVKVGSKWLSSKTQFGTQLADGVFKAYGSTFKPYPDTVGVNNKAKWFYDFGNKFSSNYSSDTIVKWSGGIGAYTKNKSGLTAGSRNGLGADIWSENESGAWLASTNFNGAIIESYYGLGAFIFSEYGTNNLLLGHLNGDTTVFLRTGQQRFYKSGVKKIELDPTTGYVDVTGGYKINGVPINTTGYSLPTASSTILGGVKVGTGLSIDGSGVLSSNNNFSLNSGIFKSVNGTLAPYPYVSSSLAKFYWDNNNNGLIGNDSTVAFGGSLKAYSLTKSGLYGRSSSGIGVEGFSGSGHGGYFKSSTGTALEAFAVSGTNILTLRSNTGTGDSTIFLRTGQQRFYKSGVKKIEFDPTNGALYANSFKNWLGSDTSISVPNISEDSYGFKTKINNGNQIFASKNYLRQIACDNNYGTQLYCPTNSGNQVYVGDNNQPQIHINSNASSQTLIDENKASGIGYALDLNNGTGFKININNLYGITILNTNGNSHYGIKSFCADSVSTGSTARSAIFGKAGYYTDFDAFGTQRFYSNSKLNASTNPNLTRGNYYYTTNSTINDTAAIVQIGNNLATKVEITGNGIVQQRNAYAEIYIADGTTAQSIPTGTTYTKLTGFLTNGLSSNCTPDYANNKITITKKGRYRVSANFSSSINTNSVTWFTTVFLGGIEVPSIHLSRRIVNPNETSSGSMSGFISVTSVPVDLDLRSHHDNASSVNLTPFFANLNAEYIGEN